MRRPAAPAAEAPGQDSFTDVVSNMVGILVILVMVVGVRAKDALLKAVPQPSAAAPAEAKSPDLASARRAAREVEADIHRVAANLDRQALEIAYRREERDRVQLLVTAAKDAIEKRRSQLDASQRARFDAQRDLIANRARLGELRRDLEAIQAAEPETAVIEHLPTPMAKVVFGRELHFRLSRGRLCHVPWDELLEALKNEAPRQIWRLKDEPQFTETLGPVGGFWMKYTLKRTESAIPTKVGVSVQRRVELDHFVLTPVSENQGEPLDQALRPASQFRTLLEQHKPSETTITVWTYPDSFAQFRALKQALYKLGYLTASRPLPDGYPIGGSPQGTRSAVE